MEFMGLVIHFFWYKLLDIKNMIRLCDGFYGGLERVAKALRVDREARSSHQAGSDSLLTFIP
jgi:CCR4-NOT transcription complex subunit 7/8